MENKTKKGFEITIDNGIGLIIGGILLQFLTGVLLFIVPVGFGILGIIQIVRGHTKEGVPNIAIAIIIAILGGLFKKIIAQIIGSILIFAGIIILIIAIIKRRRRRR